LVAVLFALCTPLAVGCGGGTKKPTPKPVESAYDKTCRNQRAKRLAAETHKRYIPPEIILRRWPGFSTKNPAPQVMSEEAMVEFLTEGKSRVMLLVARGGTGKSKLAWSVVAQSCGRQPTAKIDLNWDIAARLNEFSANPIETMAARALGAGEGDEPTAFLRKHTGKMRWLLLLDSLDEVPLTKRKKVVSAINEAMKRHDKLRALILSRPPVYAGNYGLDNVDSFAELPPLSCERTEKARRELLKDDAQRKTFATFAARYGLDRKLKTDDGRCYYPHLATYRDFHVIKKLAESSAAADMSADGADPSRGARARMYELYLTILLIKDLQTVDLLPKKGLAVIDAMIVKSKPDDGDRNVGFTIDGCVDVMEGRDGDHKRSRCERLLRSSLFVPAATKGNFKLRNQTLYDLFLARWADAQVEHGAPDPCKRLRSHARLFESNEVAGFLAGLPGGQKCLVAVATELCTNGGFAEHNHEQLDQGLPTGPRRKNIIDEARDLADKHREGPEDMCVASVLDRLFKGK